MAGSAGNFNISGGTVSALNVYVAGDPNTAGGTSTFTIGGSGVVNVGQDGSGNFTGDVHVWPGGTFIVNAGGTLNTGTFHNDGAIFENGGTFNIASGSIITGTGGTITVGSPPSPGQLPPPTSPIALNIGANTTFNGNTVTLQSGAIATATNNVMLASANGSTATLIATGTASTTIHGTLGVGNNGTLTSGSGSGVVNASGNSSTYADTIILGSTNGGSGTMTISGSASVTVGGGLQLNDCIVNGGSLVVQDQAPPAGEDLELNRSIVGGYLRDGALNVNGGTVSSPNIKLGITSGNTGTFNQTAGSVTVGVLGAGNDASETAGNGIGIVNITGGSLYAGTVLLGDANGGSGTMTISGSASVTVGGGLQMNDCIVNGGSLVVQDQAPSAGEDPELNRSIVGGHLHNGAMIVNGGTVSAPNIKLGITAGATGTFQQSAGVVTVTNILAVGNDASLSNGSGMGIANFLGGMTNAAGLLVGSNAGATGKVTVSGMGVLNVSSAITVLPGSSLTIGSGGNLNLLPHTGKATASVISTLSLSAAGKLDLTNNALDLQTASLAAVTALAAEGYAGGTWAGNGLTTSSAAEGGGSGASPYALGVISNNNGLGMPIYGSLTSPPDPKRLNFAGKSPGLNDSLVELTYYGDANLDGKVDGSDYSLIDYGYLTNLTGWYNGDFNYDGVVNGSDYTLIDNAFNIQTAQLNAQIAQVTSQVAGVSSVPEPGIVGGIALLASASTIRRRRVDRKTCSA